MNDNDHAEIAAISAHGLPDRPVPPPGPSAPVVAFIRARLDSLDATAHCAMRYTSGNWTVVPGGSMVDIDAQDVTVDGVTVKAHHWDTIIHTSSDPFVAEHIVALRPPVVLAIVTPIRRIVDLHTGEHECAGYDHNGEIDSYMYFNEFDVCPTLLHLAAPFREYPDFKPEWSLT